jgi:tetratricopeptide (TPR) repeat protein
MPEPVPPRPDPALTSTQQGEIRDALDRIDTELALHGQDPVILNRKAVALINLGRFEEALSCSRKAATLCPGEADSWITMGVALDNLGRSSEAADALERAVAIRPYHVYARALLGITYQKLDMKDSAEIQNRKLQEMVFPREYAGFFFTLAVFLLGFLLGGVRSADGNSPWVSAGAQLIIVAFFCALCGLFWRAIRTEYEVSRPPTPMADLSRDRGMTGMYFVIGVMFLAFIIGIFFGLDVWASFH